jgi:hypothetical protein
MVKGVGHGPNHCTHPNDPIDKRSKGKSHENRKTERIKKQKKTNLIISFEEMDLT